MKIEQRAQEFKNQIWETIGKSFDLYSKEMLSEFWEYWTESNPDGGRKMRFEMQKVFDTNRRLQRWKRKSQQYGKKRTTLTKEQQQYLIQRDDI